MKRLASNALAAAVGLILVLLALELGIRVFWTNAPISVLAQESLPLEKVRDPGVIYRLVPGSAGVYNGTPVKINARGLRDRDYADQAPEGSTRILVLGDSMVFGIGLPPEQTLSAQLAGCSFEVSCC